MKKTIKIILILISCFLIPIILLSSCKQKINEDEYQVTEEEFNEAVDLSTCNNFKVTISTTYPSSTYLVIVERFNTKIRNNWGPDESSLTQSYQSTSDFDPSSFYNLTVNINNDSIIQYKDLKYDKSLSCYVGEINGYYGYNVYNCKVKFLNKKLKSIEIESINPEDIYYQKLTYEYDCVEDFEIPNED